MKTYLHQTAAALVLVAGAGAADAQTVITREITTAPVETIVERGPTGTVITRRPLDATDPRAPVTLRGTTRRDPDEIITEMRETVGSSTAIEPVPAIGRHAAPPARFATAPRAQERRSVQAARKPLVRNAVNATHATTRGVRPAVARVPIDLTIAQRASIYRTVVTERAVPRTVVTDDELVAPVVAPRVGAPVVREEVVTERIVAPAPLPQTVVRETYGAAPVVTSVAAPAAVELTVGSRLPATVPLYALPPTLAVQIPAVRSYRYAQVNDRVFLVDPVTDVIVAELDE
jgi:hypothetical protein